MSEHAPLDGQTLLAYVQEVADELPSGGERRCLVVVGGALLAWHGLRDATRDVDSVEQLDATLREAVRVVAERHGLAPRWVNDSAAGYIPQGFDPSRGDEIWANDRLQVMGAPLDQVFLMKIYAGRAADVPDIKALWPSSGFQSPGDAAAAFVEAYPLEAEDPHLADWIAEQIR